MRGKEAFVILTFKTFQGLVWGLGGNDLQTSSLGKMVLGNTTQPHLFTKFTVSGQGGMTNAPRDV